MRVVVIGAGAFGGWTALFLQRSGCDVVLIDAWGPGHSRASSGGETRIIRSIYGEDHTSVRMAARSLALWKEHEERWGVKLYLRTGVIFLASFEDTFVAASKRALEAEGIPVYEFSRRDAEGKFPQFSFEGVETVLYEPEAGALLARRNCQVVAEQFVAAGGTFQLLQAAPPSSIDALQLSDGSRIEADVFVYACGPWLPKLFPRLLGGVVEPTRQEVVFVGTPPGVAMFDETNMPCWADRTSDLKLYGIPNIERRGFKIASDLRGPVFDPDNDDRILSSTTWSDVRAYLQYRFPRIGNSPLVETRVCQYENSPDLGLIIDKHPERKNTWLVGGGSGHGYKHGPAVGEYLADLIREDREPSPEFRLERLGSGSSFRRRSTI